MPHYTLAEDGSANPPVVAEDVGPYPSLEAALADWPGYHEATDAEVAEYESYWGAWYAEHEH